MPCSEVFLAVPCCGLVIAANGRTGIWAECSVVRRSIMVFDCLTGFAIEQTDY